MGTPMLYDALGSRRNAVENCAVGVGVRVAVLCAHVCAPAPMHVLVCIDSVAIGTSVPRHTSHKSHATCGGDAD